MSIADYAGDGVYMEFTGYDIVLRANDHRNPTDTIHLEKDVLEAIIRFAKNNNFIKGSDA